VIEIKDQQLLDFQGTYEEYLSSQAENGQVAGF